MKVAVGHKIINLEELYQISKNAEVVVDAQIYAELNKTAIDKGNHDLGTQEDVATSKEHARAAMACKLVQLLKLKG